MKQNFEYIDLGLSVKWASCNVGTDKPEDYGNYYNFDEAQELGLFLPTKKEWDELIYKCFHEWTGNGMKFTGPNGNSIFLPAVGYREDTNLYGASSYGSYWSSSLNTDYPNYAWSTDFYSDDIRRSDYNRYYEQSVRPIQK